jgi:predicted TIM-barrel fold metal-dependent hydrolase
VVVDSHCHLEAELPPERLLATMDAAGVDRAVLLGAAQEPLKAPKLGAAIFRGCVRLPGVGMAVYRAGVRSKRVRPIPEPDNEAVFAAARAHPERFLPFAFLNPALGEDRTMDDFDRWIAEGARGIKLHAWLHGFRLVDSVPLLRRAAAAGLPVLVHLGTGPFEDVPAALEAAPGLRLILAHGGIPHQSLRLWSLGGVWFDVAAPLVSRGTMRRIVRVAGDDRVLYGSDAPIGVRSGHGHAYDLPDLPGRVMGANALSLLG